VRCGACADKCPFLHRHRRPEEHAGAQGRRTHPPRSTGKSSRRRQIFAQDGRRTGTDRGLCLKELVRYYFYQCTEWRRLLGLSAPTASEDQEDITMEIATGASQSARIRTSGGSAGPVSTLLHEGQPIWASKPHTIVGHNLRNAYAGRTSRTVTGKRIKPTFNRKAGRDPVS